MFDLHKQCRAERDTLADEVKYLRGQVRGLQERNDRLVEALTRKDGAQLALPIESWAPKTDATAPPEGPASGPGAEVVNKWWKSLCAGGQISTPVREAKAPNS